MKPIVQKDLMRRLKFASENGSKIATLILSELERCGDNDSREIIDSVSNYFESKRFVQHGQEERYGFTVIRIFVTCCQKDVTNVNFPDRDNPSAPYLSENRTDLSMTNFANMFVAVRNAKFSQDDYYFFDNVIRIASKVNLTISNSIEDIRKAYSENFYCQTAEDSDSCLHHSCMRHEGGNIPSKAADFYANFCGASILMATDDDGYILGRAIVWPRVFVDDVEDYVPVVDRMYFAFSSVRTLMCNFAKENGILLRKRYNTYDTKREFVVLKNFGVFEEGCCLVSEAYVNIDMSKAFKRGAPYLDTFSYLVYDWDTDSMHLYNREISETPNYTVATFMDTDGTASLTAGICPVCGKQSNSIWFGVNGLCRSCRSELLINADDFGEQLNCTFQTYAGKKYPSVFFDEDGNPKKSFVNIMRVQRLME